MMLNKIALLLLALAAPLLLLPVEVYLPYPAVIEELVKLVGVLWLRPYTTTKRQLLAWSLLFGGLFAISETIFYLLNILALGQLSLLTTRIMLTGSMHLLTTLSLTMGVLLDKKNLGLWMLVGLALAMTIHASFNWLLS